MSNTTIFTKVYCTGKGSGQPDATSCDWYGERKQAKGGRCPICNSKVATDSNTPRHSTYTEYLESNLLPDEEE